MNINSTQGTAPMSSIPSPSYFAGRRLRLYSLTFACAGAIMGTAIGRAGGLTHYAFFGLAVAAYLYGLWAILRLNREEEQADEARAAVIQEKEARTTLPAKEENYSISKAELEELRDVLWAADNDIGEHLQVARYNLRGECAGDIMPIPNPPRLIHAAGIAASEKVIERLRRMSRSLHRRIEDAELTYETKVPAATIPEQDDKIEPTVPH